MKWPVSVKGVLTIDGRVVLLRNDRDEWELPGGRLEGSDSSPQVALQREFQEELAIEIEVGRILDSWIYEPLAGRVVLVVTYLCTSPERVGELSYSEEHKGVGAFPLEEIDGINLPAGYRQSIRNACSQFP